jgi:DMSO/TMAO reductase YedYZ molybdopterin-dependent catalytic subunit
VLSRSARPAPAPSPWLGRGVGALIGLLAAGVAIGVGEAVAAFVRPAASPIIVVGNRVILLTPESVRRWAIRSFGTNDKHALLTGIYVVIAVVAVVVGILAIRRLWLGLVGFAAFGGFGVYCALTSNAHRTSDIIPALVATIAALAVLILLIRLAFGEDLSITRPAGPMVTDRRRFIQAGVATAGLAALTGFGGRSASKSRYSVTKARSAVTLPTPVSAAPELPSGADLGKGGVPFITPTADFYRIDTALSVPQIDPATWSLRIHGMVDKEIRLSYADILARPLMERWITLACVSNEVGGDLIGTARFLGAPLADILREAGVHSGADQLVSRSSDGMSIGTPVAVVTDGRDAMLAVAMDGAALPVAHGFPVRMVVPGLYGYVSACKWIVDIEVTTFSAYDAYWVQEGWIPKAPVQLASRIDTPKSGTITYVGQSVNIAGVAWQQHVGISKVEVQIGDGAWTEARLAPVPSIDTWQQWVLPWTPDTAGAHAIKVRATGRDGAVQSTKQAEPYPGAASGLHQISVTSRS